MISVVIPTHQPDPAVLRRTLSGLRQQSHPAADWELVVIDNASTPPVSETFDPVRGPAATRIIREEQLGLTAARLRGFRESRSDLIILVDDDNVLAPDYLATAARFAAVHPEVGVWGGRSLPEYATTPPRWFAALGISLGCRDLGDSVLIEPPPTGGKLTGYPAMSPIGAGMVLRRAVADEYRAALTERAGGAAITDRRGGSLSSGGDCDIVLTALGRGWAVAYDPALRLEHLIPAARLSFRYLSRMAYDSNKSWVQLLALHGISPWPRIDPRTVPLRQARAFFRLQAWRGRPAYIRWRGACGTFAGQASLKP